MTLTRTLVVMEQGSSGEARLHTKSHFLEHENVYDNGEAVVRQAIVTKLSEHLDDRGNFAYAQDHSVAVVRLKGAAHGLALDETCDSPPCPWFGQHVDDTEKLTKRLYSVWWYEEKP